jgi:hypothetical protein
MPWAFIPVMMFTAMAPIQGIDWGNLVALALSAWLGNRHGRAGVIAVTIAWAAMSFRISVGDFTFGLRLDYGLTAILLAFVSAHPSPGLLLRGAFERALQSRIAWLVTLTAPVVVQLPLVANNERIYFGASIGFSLLVAVLPLLAAASRAPRTVYQRPRPTQNTAVRALRTTRARPCRRGRGTRPSRRCDLPLGRR